MTAHQFKARLAGHGAFGQGQLEGSNVTIVDEMVNMITPKDSMKPIQRLCKLLIRCCSQQITWGKDEVSFYFSSLKYFFAGFADKSELKAQKSTVRVKDPIRLGFLVQGDVSDLELSQKLYNLVVLPPGERRYKGIWKQGFSSFCGKTFLWWIAKVTFSIPEISNPITEKFYLFGWYPKQIIRQTQSFCHECTVVLRSESSQYQWDGRDLM